MRQVVWNKETCTGCGLCAAVCPFGAIELTVDKLTITEACRLCLQCVKNCPQEALKVSEDFGSAKDVPKFGSSTLRPEDTSGIMIVAEYHDQAFEPVTFELAGKALELAAKANYKVTCVTMGSNLADKARELLHYGIDKVVVYEHPSLENPVPDLYADVLYHAVMRLKPSAVLVGATVLGRAVAPRLAVKLRTGLTADCTILDMRPDGTLVQTRPAFGGNIMATIITANHRPQMATVRYKVMDKAKYSEEIIGSLETVDVGKDVSLAEVLKAHSERIKVMRTRPIPRATSIADADVIVALGRALRSEKDIPMFQELADKLGGMLACTRPLVEKGWFGAAAQIGLSGRTVRPKLYIACGISGAVQHVAGMSRSDTIVAINTDKNAPIFDVATYAVVGDMYQIVPEFLRYLSGGVRQ